MAVYTVWRYKTATIAKPGRYLYLEATWAHESATDDDNADGQSCRWRLTDVLVLKTLMHDDDAVAAPYPPAAGAPIAVALIFPDVSASGAPPGRLTRYSDTRRLRTPRHREEARDTITYLAGQ